MTREDYVKEYLELDDQKREIASRQGELKKLMAMFKRGDIVEVNDKGINYAGKRGMVIACNTQIYKQDVKLYYVLKKVKKDGTIGENNLGMTLNGFPEDYLTLIKPAEK